MPGHCALMGATRLASGKDSAIIYQSSHFPTFSTPTRDASPPLVLAFSCSALRPYQAAMFRKPIAPPSTNQWLQTPQSYSFCPKMRQKDAVFAVSAQKNAVKVCRLRGNAYFCTRNSGCSSARLEYASGGRVVAGSNPVTPTLNCTAVSCSRS